MARPKGSGVVPLIERMWRKTVVSEGGCWLWTGAINHNGYGHVGTSSGMRRVHRVSYEMTCGAIPEGVFVLHRCDIRHCWNPEHLFLGSASENSADMVNKDRHVPAPSPGVQNGNALLDDEKVRAIRADTRRIVDIADAYGVHFTTISDIRRGKSWKHVR